MQSCKRADVSALSDGRVLLVRVRGVVTLTSIRAVRSAISDRTEGVSAAVLDYSKAAVAITEDDLRALSPPPAHDDVPAAWVVPTAEIAESWRRQALRFALCGLRRFVCCDPDEAVRWARQQAELAALPGSRR